MNENELKLKLKLCERIPADVLDELVERTCLVANWFTDWIYNKGKSNVNAKQLERCMNQIEEYASSLYELNDAISDLSKVKIGFDNQSFFDKIGKPSIYDSVSVSDDAYSLDSFEVDFNRVKKLKVQTEKRKNAALHTVGITFYSTGRMKDEVSYHSVPFINNEPTFNVPNLLYAIESVAKKYKEKKSRDEVLQSLKCA